MIWKIAKIGNCETVDFAATELKRYLTKIDATNDYILMSCRKYDAERKDVLWVGCSSELPLPKVKDSKYDDAISICVKKNAGYITGANPRSVLIAAYRFLRELGCAFIRPGADGEVIPSYELKDVDVQVFEKASYRHRAVCIEGADSYDNVANMIDWLPKVGMNGYFNQFDVPYHFYKLWYQSEFNPMYEGESFTREDAIGIRNQSIREISRRGMLYHATGHGWTCEPFGIEGGGWDTKPQEISDKTRSCLALLNGKREFFGGVPLNTNLCYSSDYVKDTIAKAVAEYCKDIPEVNYLHVWLADGSNNHCECENCLPHRPADLYIDLLNRIDEELTKENIDVKVVFLIYVDLLWEPIRAKLNNPDRFTLMFAPITRSYSQTLSDAKELRDDELSPFVKNKLTFPENISENIAYLKKWQKIFKGDSFDFDYHYMWDHYNDLGYYESSKLLFKDMAELDRVGINGMVSCQVQRCFLPTSLGMLSMAEALWNKNADFDTMADKYFLAAFGADGGKVQDYLAEISRLNDLPYMRAEKKVINAENAENFAKMIALVDSFLPEISAHLDDDKLCHAQKLSWKYLTYHAERCKLLASSLVLTAKGEIEKAKEKLKEANEYAGSIRHEVQNVFDDRGFVNTMNWKVGNLWQKAEAELKEKNK